METSKENDLRTSETMVIEQLLIAVEMETPREAPYEPLIQYTNCPESEKYKHRERLL